MKSFIDGFIITQGQRANFITSLKFAGVKHETQNMKKYIIVSQKVWQQCYG